MDYRDEIYFHFDPGTEIPFAREEYAARLTRIRERMASAGIRCLYLSSPESMFYVSGYRCEWYQAESPTEWPPTNGIAVHVDHDRFILFDTEREAALGRLYTVSEDTRYFPRTSYRDGSHFVAETLAAEGWLDGRLGLEFWAHRPNRAVSDRFERRFRDAGAEVVDGSAIVREVRWVKSPAEIQCLEEAARIADVGLDAARGAIRPGATELEVYGAVVHAMAAAGGENPGITMPVLSGPKANCAHALAGRRRMQAGELVLVDVCGVYNRYHMNGARTFALGEPAPEVMEVAARAAASMDLLASIAKPDVRVGDLCRAMMDYYVEQDLWGRRGWIGGYEMGIAFPPDWVGNFVYDPLSEKNADRRFEPGTAVNYENQFFLPGGVGLYFMIESLLFTEEQAKLPSRVPYPLAVIE